MRMRRLISVIREYSWGFFPIVVLCAIINQIVHIPYGIDSIYDEGFLYLNLLKNQAGVVEGVSQWAVITNTLLGANLSITELRYAGYFIGIFSVLVFIVTVSYFLYQQYPYITKKQHIVISSFILAIATLSLSGIIIHYNEWQRLWYMLILSGFLCFIACDKEWVKNIALGLVGFFSLYAILTILPGGVLVLGCVVILILLKDYKNAKFLLFHFASLFVGLFFALLIFHCCFENLFTIWDQIQLITQTVTKLNRGYDPLSFLVSLMLFCRDAFFCMAILIGFCWCGAKIRKIFPHSSWFAFLFLLFAIGVYAYYQQRPSVTTAMIFSLAFVGPLFEHFESYPLRWDNKRIFEYAFLFFLFAFPVIASMGTNIYIGGKMTYFLVPWGLLTAIVTYRNAESTNRYLWILLLLFIVPMVVKSDKDNVCKFDKSEVVEDRFITQSQFAYYSNVYEIVHQYGFEKGKSVIFSTQLDAMTSVVLGADFCGPYFQPMDFNAVWQMEEKIPDFIFLSQVDKNVCGETLIQMGIGFPEDFDEYYIGTPETSQTVFSTERWLYCRKTK